LVGACGGDADVMIHEDGNFEGPTVCFEGGG
jgi:hypothetical protein